MKTRTIKKGCGIIAIILIVIIIGFFWAFNEAFGEDKYSVTIEQNIGGKLICDVTYSADLQSWYYFINYKYLTPKGKSYDFGNGMYQGIEWNENDQLFKYKKWTILITGTDFDAIKIISYDLTANKKSESIIEPHSIQKDSLWKSRNIEAVLMWSPSKVEIDTIINNRILVDYTFRIDRENPDNLGSRLIEYELDNLNGKVEMKSISE
jgi:hypothetical protein